MNSKKINFIKKTFLFLFILALLSLFIYLFFDMKDAIKQSLLDRDLSAIEEKFISYGNRKYYIIAACQAFFLVTTVLPVEIPQIIAGFSCGTIPGFICSMTGIFIGNVIIFLIYRVFAKILKPTLNDKNAKKMEEINNKSKDKNKGLLIALSLYFIPGVTYGIAAVYAANNKMSFIKYILLTTIAAIPTTLMCTIFGNFAIQEKYIPLTILFSTSCLVLIIVVKYKNKLINHLSRRNLAATIIWFTMILIVTILSIIFSIKNDLTKLFYTLITFFGIILLYLIFNKPLSKLFDKTRKKAINMEYFQSPVPKANSFVYSVLRFFTRLYFFRKCNVKVDKNMPKFEEPSILMFNHPAKLDFLYSFIPVYPKKVSPVVAFYYFCNYRVGKLLRTLGGFPKYLYQPDISAMKNIIRVVKRGGILGISPEGRLTPYGCMEKIIPSTAKMVKKLGVQVVIAKIHGSYFTTPKWAYTSRRGVVTVRFEEILTKEQIKELSVHEIYEILKRECDYDEFKWQEKAHVSFKGKRFAEGLEDILYICPVCKKEFTYTSSGDTITCSHCHTEVKLDKYYQFSSSNKQIPANIRDWYLFQKETARKEIEDPNYSLTSHVTLKFPSEDGHGFRIAGEGYTTLDKRGILFKGVIDNEEKEIQFKIENLHAIPFGVREDFEIYHFNTLFYFIPDNIRECVKWSVVTEQMYAKYLQDNNLQELEVAE